jgi:hypothetical protein
MKWALLVVGVLGAGVIGTLAFLSLHAVELGGECSFSTDCKTGSCETIQYDPNHLGLKIRHACVIECGNTPCPPRFACTPIKIQRLQNHTVVGEETKNYCLPK